MDPSNQTKKLEKKKKAQNPWISNSIMITNRSISYIILLHLQHKLEIQLYDKHPTGSRDLSSFWGRSELTKQAISHSPVVMLL